MANRRKKESRRLTDTLIVKNKRKTWIEIENAFGKLETTGIEI